MASALGGGRGSIARQTALLEVFCSDGVESSDAIDFSGAAGGMIFVGPSEPTSLAVYVAPTQSGPFVPLVVEGEPLVIETAANSAFAMPDALFGATFVKLQGEGECTVQVSLKG